MGKSTRFNRINGGPFALVHDVPGPTLSRSELLGNAPDAALESGLFKVPRVIG